MESELRAREKELSAKDAKRKQIILRLPESLWREIARWAEDDFRSINGQIEYILTNSVREHRKQRST
ncbi:MAG: Arc family DNA-binding protein [Firmicutes bacterium]|nr:Arc family DNA-binding protein [Bacillota bacterium]